MNRLNLTEEEYHTHIDALRFFDTTRNTLLTFAFTTVLALLGVIVATKEPIHPLICLVPYFLIIPFAARISYYRLASAHINTFLKCIAPEKTIFANGSSVVHEKHGKTYMLIKWFVNHEMVVLALAVGLIYCYEYYNYSDKYRWYGFLLPIVFIFIVYIISGSTYSYRKLCNIYAPQWEKYLEK